MNEVADAANNLPAILLLWFWWTLLSVIEMATRARDQYDVELRNRLTSPTDTRAGTQDERFAEILGLDPAFSLDAFLEGARKAYEIILEAYAAADMETLKPLLSPEVLATFATMCAGRAERGEMLDLTFVGIDGVDVDNVEVTTDAMEITLLFHAQVIRSTRSADDAVISGDPTLVSTVDERWTFSRAVPVSGKAWTVVATGG